MLVLANYEPTRAGGGWTFCRNLVSAMSDVVTANYDSASIYFIAGATMAERDQVLKAKADGKKVVLRVDNAVRNSRNRNTGMSRMFDFAQLADLVIYQSEWAKDYLRPFLKKDGPVILNAVDLESYCQATRQQSDRTTYLYTRYNRDETKNFEMVRYWYSRKHQTSSNSDLWLVGNFSQELVEGNFDLYQDERFTFFGPQPPEAMPTFYGGAHVFLYSYFMDCCSNSLIEALVSGCAIEDVYGMLGTGGAPEIMQAYQTFGRDYFGLERMAKEYGEALGQLL